ncbi:MAG: hypothetical protein ACK5WN_01300 [Alphaproteobacteria bacterium]|jgi:hypothetical protein|nr:hypothetical protein [Roseomonas sp.]
MRLITLPIAMLFLVLSLGGCLASGGHHSPSFGYGYGGYGYAPYGGHAHRHYRHSYRAFEPHRHYRHHHHHHHRPLFPHRPIWKKW